VCKRQGARELAFPTIISSAENHPYLHYSQYNRLLVEGDFLVFDAGPKWQDYCMDTSISFPINGRFSPRQREIYQACLEIAKGCLARYRPGLTGYQIGEGVRVENTVLVTDSGCEILNPGIPREMEEIEALMGNS